MIAGVNASLRLGSVDLCDCWHQGVIQAGQPGLMQGADEVNVGFGIHLSLCVWGSPRLCKGFGRLSAFSQIPGTDIWAFASVGCCWEGLGGVRGPSWKLHGVPGELLGRSGALGAASGCLWDAPGRPGMAHTLRL